MVEMDTDSNYFAFSEDSIEKFSCKGIQKDNNKISYKKFENVLLNKKMTWQLIKVFVM